MSLKVKGIIIISFICFVLLRIVSATTDSYNHVKQSLADIQRLELTNVKSIELYPLPDPVSLIDHPIVIRDTAAIRGFVIRYKLLGKNRSGNGKLPGDWQIMVNIKLDNGQGIYSRVYHNEYADLVFIQASQHPSAIGLEDLLVDSNHGISKIVERYK